MRGLLVVLLVLVGACARHAALVTPVSARVSVADASGVTTFTIPARVPHYLAFCDPMKSWSSARWYLVRVDGVDRPNFGPVVPEGPLDCYKTPTSYAFEPGSHQVDVLFINHCAAGATEPLCVTVSDQPGPSTTVTTVATLGLLTVAPPPIVKGRIIQ